MKTNQRPIIVTPIALARVLIFSCLLFFIVQGQIVSAQTTDGTDLSVDSVATYAFGEELMIFGSYEHMFGITLESDLVGNYSLPSIVVRIYEEPDSDPSEAIWQTTGGGGWDRPWVPEQEAQPVNSRIATWDIGWGPKNEVPESPYTDFRDVFDGRTRYIGISLENDPANEYRQPIETVQYAIQSRIAQTVDSGRLSGKRHYELDRAGLYQLRQGSGRDPDDGDDDDPVYSSRLAPNSLNFEWREPGKCYSYWECSRGPLTDYSFLSGAGVSVSTFDPSVSVDHTTGITATHSMELSSSYMKFYRDRHTMDLLDMEFNGGDFETYVGVEKIVTPILEITGGADLAEPFVINDTSAVEPGTVVVLDADKPGELRVAQNAYDSLVAGVVSGAGDIHPGLIMQQGNETTIDGQMHPVALTGKVYVKAVGPIAVGDLLTTSDVPGYAMAATDRERAFGATIGKAMSPLEDRLGLVLVLVGLQ